ncbi:MAG: preprotein translocase subunit SecA [Prevotellaceae bacterium]|jgi:preprotein translocase subunit SecA|nr:preprotein translocase subunit SecA [Prevotellaceae bacterium]
MNFGNFINSSLAKIFGTKSEKDLKLIMPRVAEINGIYPKIAALSNDELRALSSELKQKIRAYYAEEEQEIAELKQEMESPDLSIKDKEDLYTKIDDLTEEVDHKIEEILQKLLPEAFAIVKSTAQRFKENEQLVVTATDFDRELAAKKANVVISGDKAVWTNKWMAGGNLITWDMVHYDVQLAGGIVLNAPKLQYENTTDGKKKLIGAIAEMGTGEGKTLVATLPVFLNALAGKGVHVVTVNSYLSQRDSEWMGPIYEFHGLSVDCIDKHEPHSPARRNAYAADITFGTNNEFGFDYLRDNMVFSPDELVQRKHHYAIVDEVDSVLIDDARTPLIIAGPVPRGDDQMFNEYKPFVEKLYSAQRNLVTQLLSESRKLIAENKLREGGELLYRAHKGLPKYKPIIKFLSEQGNKSLMQETENFYMQENSKKMPHLINNLTDEDKKENEKIKKENERRIKEGLEETEEKKFGKNGLFFAIDEKQNSVELAERGIEFISEIVNDHSFFVMPDVGVEMEKIETGNMPLQEKEAAKSALFSDYSIKSERLHTIHQLLKAYTMFEKEIEYVVMDNKVKIVDEQTGRILEGRRYSDGLHQAIEAKENVKIEAATQTFATITLQNYFRMYHKLAGMTGTAETEAGEFWKIYYLDVIVIPTNKPVIRNDYADLIYKTKREKYKAVVAEIEKLSKMDNRPVLVGTTSVEISELLSTMLKRRNIKHNVLNAKQHQREAEIVAEAGQAGTVTIATNMAGRGTDIKLGNGVKDAGGLAIIGTERHESRRVDRQLRGRSGRQGDPGTSQFYVSLEDNLMRLFGSERISKIMDTLGIKEDEVIQASMLSRQIEKAQRKVEENHSGIRKRLLEYDDVMNSQRKVIYSRRNHALYGERVDVDIFNMISDYCDSLAEQLSGLDYKSFCNEIFKTLCIQPPFGEEEYAEINSAEIAEKLAVEVENVYNRQIDSMSERIFPLIKNVYEKQGRLYENIQLPISDGHKILNVSVNLKEAYETKGRALGKSYSKTIMLVMIDEHWKEHLREMDELKQSVQNATFEQKDPLLIYKFESYNLFKNMLNEITREMTGMLMKARIALRDESDVRQSEQRRTDMSKMQTRRDDLATSSGSEESRAVMPVKVEKRPGRNDACPCGSGKKYKNCHGRPEQ